MLEPQPLTTFSVSITPKELKQLTNQIEKAIISKIESNPDKFFPFKPFELILYSTAEVAKILKISEATVRNRCKDGSMSHIKPDGRNIQLTQEQLTEYIEAMKTARTNG